MTLEEMQKVADICSTADNGCSVCVGDLAALLSGAFPEFVFGYGEEEKITLPVDDEYSREYYRIVVRFK